MSKSDTSRSSYETVRTDKSMSQETHEQYVENIDPASVDPRDFNISYDPTCVQKLGNFGSSNARFLFDHKSHEPLTRDNLKVISPKLLKIVEEIERQDAQDMQKYGKKFKHFVFSNVKSGTGGAKIIATALMDILGMKLGYSADRKGSDSKGENADLYQAVVENQSPDLKADSKGINSEKEEEETFEDIFEDAIEDAAEERVTVEQEQNLIFRVAAHQQYGKKFAYTMRMNFSLQNTTISSYSVRWVYINNHLAWRCEKRYCVYSIVGRLMEKKVTHMEKRPASW